MTPDEHQRERMRAWVTVFAATIPTACGAHVTADGMLDSFDKRFPAPSAAAPVEPDQSAMGMAVSSLILDQTAELAALRQKARLWDAVASGKLGIYPRDGDFAVHWDVGHSMKATAEEAVEAAIAAGALK